MWCFAQLTNFKHQISKKINLEFFTMNLRALWQFYKTIFPFVMAFAIVSVIALGVFWGFILFCTLGLWFGIVGFSTFRKGEYYFYYNLGLTKWKLIKASFFFNLLVGVPIFTLLLIFLTFVFGRLTII